MKPFNFLSLSFVCLLSLSSHSQDIFIKADLQRGPDGHEYTLNSKNDKFLAEALKYHPAQKDLKKKYADALKHPEIQEKIVKLEQLHKEQGYQPLKLEGSKFVPMMRMNLKENKRFFEDSVLSLCLEKNCYTLIALKSLEENSPESIREKLDLALDEHIAVKEDDLSNSSNNDQNFFNEFVDEDIFDGNK